MMKLAKSRRHRDRNGGLSLIEMIVVMAIISLFAGLVGPRIGAGLAGLELRRAERAVIDSLRHAKTYARQSGSTVFVVFEGEDHRVLLLSSDMQVIRENVFPDSVELVGVPSDKVAFAEVAATGLVRGEALRLRGRTGEVEIALR